MILALDVGNTNITVGCIVDGDIEHVFRISTNAAKTADEFAIQISSMLAFYGIEKAKIEGAVMSSVVPQLTNTFKEAVFQLTGAQPVVVGAGVKTGLNILIDDPAQLGGDMVATAVGTLSSYSLPAIVVDFGTATKLFVLNKSGGFLGGAILPGVALSMDALAAGTSQLPRIPIEAPGCAISSNTVDCIKSGVVFGAASAIDGMVDRFEAELGEGAVVIATGGLAEAVFHFCRREVLFDPLLTLRGLGVIYHKNMMSSRRV